jgi:class 3 adenylate cyclase
MSEVKDFGSKRSDLPKRHSAPSGLATIVVGNISRYSHLMQIDKEGTHGRVKQIEREVIGPAILEHHGRLIQAADDGFIAIFDSPFEAARCGIHIRHSMIERNASLPRHHRIQSRIGVNLGDVVSEPDDVYGECVNIASSLATVAGPDQICISGGMYELMKHKLVCGYQSLGDHKVKNIAARVSVYRLLPDPGAFHRIQRRRENILIFLLSLALLVIASGTLWFLFGQSHHKSGVEVFGTQFLQDTERYRSASSATLR